MTHMYFSARAEGRISYGHLGHTNSCFTCRVATYVIDIRRAFSGFAVMSPQYRATSSIEDLGGRRVKVHILQVLGKRSQSFETQIT